VALFCSSEVPVNFRSFTSGFSKPPKVYCYQIPTFKFKLLVYCDDRSLCMSVICRMER
jgi:hypothetical protein